MKIDGFPTSNGDLNGFIRFVVDRMKLTDLDFDKEYGLILEKKSKFPSNTRKTIIKIIEMVRDPGVYNKVLSDAKLVEETDDAKKSE